jgi:predicted CoA-substrate-specific enzyme activase
MKPKLFAMGVDSGSLTAKAVIMDDEYNLLAYRVNQYTFVSEEAVRVSVSTALADAGLSMDDIEYVVTTGYGRRKIEYGNKAITEITCHAKGANFVFPRARTVLDVGGQDSKVISVDESGNVLNFVMNDTCAAGTGQFIEVMARSLGLDVTQVGELSLKAQQDIRISATCTVFAESEIISLAAQHCPVEEILGAVLRAIARRTVALSARVGVIPPLVMTGGVAKNIGMVKYIEREVQTQVFVPREPQIVGAIGAAIFAVDYARANRRRAASSGSTDPTLTAVSDVNESAGCRSAQ